uniref:Neuropeptide-22 n=1 Tax=Schmidtea mediterranea TaxID=79327 RepID=E3CTL3_SCHMD|nr:TPA_inf: neuropeptide precursor-22 [Schmidtea mediterranea]
MKTLSLCLSIGFSLVLIASLPFVSSTTDDEVNENICQSLCHKSLSCLDECHDISESNDSMEKRAKYFRLGKRAKYFRLGKRSFDSSNLEKRAKYFRLG